MSGATWPMAAIDNKIRHFLTVAWGKNAIYWRFGAYWGQKEKKKRFFLSFLHISA
jgi:hypothetical protein